MEQAIAIALGLYPGATVIEAELTRKGGPWDGRLAWDVKLNNGLAVYVDAVTGEVLEIEPIGGGPGGPGEPGEPGEPNPGEAVITRDQAVTIALALYPGANVLEVDLTRKGGPWNGRLAWDVKLNNRWAVYVDALTGQVLEVERLP
jgi:uncharacterized membrane protein YkoI